MNTLFLIFQGPEKCDDLSRFAFDDLSETTILYIQTVLEHVQNGKRYSEMGWRE